MGDSQPPGQDKTVANEGSAPLPFSSFAYARGLHPAKLMDNPVAANILGTAGTVCWVHPAATPDSKELPTPQHVGAASPHVHLVSLRRDTARRLQPGPEPQRRPTSPAAYPHLLEPHYMVAVQVLRGQVAAPATHYQLRRRGLCHRWRRGRAILRPAAGFGQGRRVAPDADGSPRGAPAGGRGAKVLLGDLQVEVRRGHLVPICVHRCRRGRGFDPGAGVCVPCRRARHGHLLGRGVPVGWYRHSRSAL